MVKAVMSKYGKIDILINNAGITQDSLLLKMSEEQWKRVVEIKLTGVFNCIQAVTPAMITQGFGTIINASSVVGFYGNIGQSNYTATKAGIIGLTTSFIKRTGA